MELTPFIAGVIIIGVVLAGIIYSIGKKIFAWIVVAIAVAVLIFGISFQEAFQFTTNSIQQVVDKVVPTIEEELQSGEYKKLSDGTESITSKNFALKKTEENDYQITISSIDKTFSLKEFLEMIPKDTGNQLQQFIEAQFTEKK